MCPLKGGVYVLAKWGSRLFGCRDDGPLLVVMAQQDGEMDRTVARRASEGYTLILRPLAVESFIYSNVSTYTISCLIKETRTSCYAWALLSSDAHSLFRTGGVPLATVRRRLLTRHAVLVPPRH